MKRKIALAAAASLTLLSAAFAAPAEAAITNHGGRVLTIPKVRVIFLGSDWNNGSIHLAQTEAFVQDAFNRYEFYYPLAEYGVFRGRVDSISVNPITLTNDIVYGRCTGGLGSVQCPTNCTGHSTPCMTNNEAIKAVTDDACSKPFDPMVAYLVVAPYGAQPSLVNAAGQHFEMPLQCPNEAAPRGQIAFGMSQADYSAMAHEVMEMATDPYQKTNPAWADLNPYAASGEIEDVCYARQEYQSFNGVQLLKVYSVQQDKCLPFAAWDEFPGQVALNLDSEPTPSWSSVTTYDSNASFVALQNAYDQGQAALFGIQPNQEVHYKNANNGWSFWITPTGPGWVSRIAAVNTGEDHLIGIGGDQRLWWKIADKNTLGENFQRVSDFTVNDVVASRGDAFSPGAMVALDTAGGVHYQFFDNTTSLSTSAWTTMPGLPAAATKIAATSYNGQLYVVATVGTGAIYMARSIALQVSGRVYRWYAWQLIQGGTGSAVRQLVAGNAADGRPAIFALLENGDILRSFEVAGDSAGITRNWAYQWFPLARQISVANGADGRIELFAIDAFGRVSYAIQHSTVDDDWGGPGSLGGYLATIQAFRWPSGEVEVFGTDPITKQIAHNWQGIGTDTAWNY